jgi:DNA repair protein RadC
MQQMSFLRTQQDDDPYRPQVSDLPVRDRPVNRLREAGPGALSTTEVLACLIQTPDALNQAQELLARFEGLPGLVRASVTEITEVDGIGPANASRIKAALEFGRRLNLAAREERPAVRSPSDLATILLPEMAHLEREHFLVVCLDTRNNVVHKQTLYVGSLNATHIRVAEVFQEPIRRNAAAIIVAHNHPSGDPSPSREDLAVTRQIREAGEMLNIELLDHLVIGDQRFVSMRERGLGFDE